MLRYAGLAVTIAGTAVVMDLRTARVDNGWIVFSLVTGLVLRIFTEGPGCIGKCLPGALLPLVFPGLLFTFRMLGPGDIKLFCALGSLMGASDILKCIFTSFLLGAAIALAILISDGGFRQRFLYLIQYFRELSATGEWKPYYRRGTKTAENFHFTVPVFLSVVLYAGGVY